MRSRITSVLVAFATFISSQAMALEYHGYFRSGLGFSRGGTDQACFRAPGTEGASGKFRLGNECETYIELSLSENHGGDAKGSDPYFKSHVRLAFQSQGHRDWEPDTPYCTTGNCTNEDGTATTLSANFLTSLREAYGEAFNILPLEASFWVGKRFYKRRDIHMMDYYLLENAGPGFGFENFNLGGTKVSIATTHNIPDPDHKDGPAQTNIDLRADLEAMGGTLSPVFMYGASSTRGHSSGDEAYESLSGFQLGLFYSFGLLGGSNTLGVQYGTGIYGANVQWHASTLTQYGAFGSQTIAEDADELKDARDDSSTLRLVNHLVINPMPALSTGFVVFYQDVNFGGYKDGSEEKEVPNKKELSAGVRPIWHATKGFDLAFEYGLTSVSDYRKQSYDADKGLEPEYENAQLQKVTIAPQFSPASSYWARPQLRLFATYASWNEESKGSVGGPVYAKDESGFSTGAQVEVWW